MIDYRQFDWILLFNINAKPIILNKNLLNFSISLDNYFFNLNKKNSLNSINVINNYCYIQELFYTNNLFIENIQCEKFVVEIKHTNIITRLFIPNKIKFNDYYLVKEEALTSFPSFSGKTYIYFSNDIDSMSNYFREHLISYLFTLDWSKRGSIAHFLFNNLIFLISFFIKRTPIFVLKILIPLRCLVLYKKCN